MVHVPRFNVKVTRDTVALERRLGPCDKAAVMEKWAAPRGRSTAPAAARAPHFSAGRNPVQAGLLGATRGIDGAIAGLWAVSPASLVTQKKTRGRDARAPERPGRHTTPKASMASATFLKPAILAPRT